ncbi:MAG: WXG100 family type VII secretion target [Oscillospiraceae bacterium]
MAGQIRISPEQMHLRAVEFRTEGENFQSVIKKMESLIGMLKEEWEGQASRQFDEQFNHLMPSFDKMRELINDIGSQLDGTANAIADLDDEISKKFSI